MWRYVQRKNIEFLISACNKIRSEIENFQIIFIGGSPDAILVNNFAVEKAWVLYVGEITGNAKVPYFMISKVLLVPGLVGLAVLNSFALNVPMVTTDISIHSPEFEYLVSGTNGVVTSYGIGFYSSAGCRLFNDNAIYSLLLEGYKKSCSHYSIENMAANFATGICAALSNKNTN